MSVSAISSWSINLPTLIIPRYIFDGITHWSAINIRSKFVARFGPTEKTRSPAEDYAQKSGDKRRAKSNSTPVPRGIHKLSRYNSALLSRERHSSRIQERLSYSNGNGRVRGRGRRNFYDRRTVQFFSACGSSLRNSRGASPRKRGALSLRCPWARANFSRGQRGINSPLSLPPLLFLRDPITTERDLGRNT